MVIAHDVDLQGQVGEAIFKELRRVNCGGVLIRWCWRSTQTGVSLPRRTEKNESLHDR